MKVKQKVVLFILFFMIVSLAFSAGCFKTVDTQEVKELQEKVEKLEAELAELGDKDSKEEMEGDEDIIETEATINTEETSATDETQVIEDVIVRDKICLVDYSLSDFTKFQTLGYEYDLNLIKEFEPAAYNSISLAVLFKPDDARLTKLFDYTNKGGKAICYYYKYSIKYNDTFKQLFGVSIIEEDVLKDHTNSVTLDGELFSDFTGGLKISYINKSTMYMRIPVYINDIDKNSIWNSEFASNTTNKKNYFALIKNIGDGQVLFIPHVSEIIPFNDKHFDDMDNSLFAESIIEWSFK